MQPPQPQDEVGWIQDLPLDQSRTPPSASCFVGADVVLKQALCRAPTPTPPLKVSWQSGLNIMQNLLKHSIVDQELGGQCRQQSDADSQAKPAAGAVERPPQPDGERRQCQRQLHVVGKVHFLMGGGLRIRGRQLQLCSRRCAGIQQQLYL